MAVRRRAARLALVALVAFLAQVVTVPAYAGAAVNGSGSTFAFIAIQQWMSDVAKQGLSVNFQPKGSTQGRTDFTNKLVDFASSDVSYNFPGGLGNETKPSFGYTYMPLVAGGTAIMVNLKDNAGRPISNLQLSGPLLVKLFTQNMFSCADPGANPEMYWDDPAVKADNPSIAAQLPHVRVRPVVRAGGSGTTAVFTDYLNHMDPQRWKAYMQGIDGNPNGCATTRPTNKCTPQACGATDEWPDRPDIDRVDGSDRVAIQVKQGNPSWGWIGYAEYAYAKQLDVPVATIRNVAGNYTLPTACNQAIALTNARRNEDGTYNLDGVHTHPSPSAYPISSYNYVIVPTDGLDPAKGETLAKFVLYSITDGQKNVDKIGYSPLPTNLIQEGFAVLGQVPGHPAIPNADQAATWGKFYKSLKLPDGTSCEQEGQETKNDPPPQENNNGGNNNGGGGGDQNNGQNNNQNNQNDQNNQQNSQQNNNQNKDENKNQNDQNKDQKNDNANKQNTNKQNTNKTNQNGTKTPNGTPTKNGTGGKTPSPGASTGAPQPGQNTGDPTAPGTTGPSATGDPGAVATNGLPTSGDPNVQQVPGAPGTPGATGNGMINPTLAANAAREVNTVAAQAGTPWGLFGLALLLVGIVFAPVIIGGARRLARVGRPGGE
ncbi:hypothetical protein DQ384_13560 [Sphaerisporangium album]|uniref:PBP domain-containing protein n=1 Tax=Sphaerisporangium album TaxID=509200 RepID=A0A367FKZ7_9ACTN|nr:substrate-binding domain-containing protein [Sphaerisporangium album]RCG30974.1 hypothetical protein DQ384_13560 [Sphaerisporangium album]